MNQENLKFKPIKDGIIYTFLIAVILSLFFMILSFKSSSSNNLKVEIRYQNKIIKDIETNLDFYSFPNEKERKVTLKKEDSSKYIDTDFIFDELTITLYSDKSIQILKDDISCFDHLCSKLGRIYEVYTPLVCLPNQIEVMIINNAFPESVN